MARANLLVAQGTSTRAAVVNFRFSPRTVAPCYNQRRQSAASNSPRKTKSRLIAHAALSGTSDADHHNPVSHERLATYMKLARIHNLAPSITLVMVGAWAGSGHRVAAIQSLSVWLMGLISGGMAVASCVVNDYFDLRVDAANAPDKPLPSGAITPDAALLLSSVIYCGCLIAACLMEPSRLRSIVAFSAAATLLYTPLFKKLTAIKNATVATVIALAPLAGALAAGAGDAGLLRLMPATAFAFSGVMFREILMDLNDAEGDQQAQVWTLPVMLGKPAALLCAVCFLALGSGAALLRLLKVSAISEWLSGPGVLESLQAGAAGLGLIGLDVFSVCTGLATWVPVTVLMFIVGQLFGLAVGVWRSCIDPEVVSKAVGECLKHVGWGILLLAAMGLVVQADFHAAASMTGVSAWLGATVHVQLPRLMSRVKVNRP